MVKRKVLIVGYGHREAAVARMLRKDPEVGKIFFPKGASPSTLKLGGLATLGGAPVAASNYEDMIGFCKDEYVDLVVAGSENDYAKGIVDVFQEQGIPIFGPNKKAAQYEADKPLGKLIMIEAGVLTPRHRVFSDGASAEQYIDSVYGANGAVEDDVLLVVKHPSGLQGGKGVLKPNGRQDAKRLSADMLSGKFSDLSPTDQIMIEEFAGVDGRIFEEVSCMVITDGQNYIPLPFTQDHKAAFDGDKGPNTGGMGAYGPCSITTGHEQRIFEGIIEPVLKTMAKHEPMKGVLYTALYFDPRKEEWGVFEFNVRFGDPEVVPLSILLKSKNFYQVLHTVATGGDISNLRLEWYPGVALTTILTNKAYPDKGLEYEGNNHKSVYGTVDPVFKQPWCQLDQAATAYQNEGLVNTGGRCMALTTLGTNIVEAHERNLLALSKLRCDGLRYRTDIGHRDIARYKQVK